MTIVAIAAGVAHVVALTDEGTVISWGAAPTPPEGLSDVRAIAAGQDVSLALLANGTVVGWGTTEVPEGLSDVVAITAGGRVCFAVQSDGNVVGWRKNPDHVFDPTEPVTCPAGTLPAAVSLFGGFVLGLSRDGRVALETLAAFASGYLEALPPSWSSSITAVSAGFAHALAITADGEVLSLVTGGHLRHANLATPLGVERAAAIAAGGAFSVALLANGNVVSWGKNEFGQTEVPAHLSKAVAVAAGDQFGVALTADGGVAAWGRNNHGQTDIPRDIAAVIPRDIAAVIPRDIAAVIPRDIAAVIPKDIAAVPQEHREGRPVGPLILIGEVEPRVLIVDGHPDEKSEIKLSDVPSEESLLKDADEWMNLSEHEPYQHLGRRNAACLFNNLAARQIERGVPLRALAYLQGATMVLGGIRANPDDSSELVSSALLVPVARAAIAFNFALAQLRLGKGDDYRWGVTLVVEHLMSATGHWTYSPGGSIADRVELIRTVALPRLFEESIT